MFIPKEIEQFTFEIKKLVFAKKFQDFCKCPYPRHPKGCPNYGHRDHCPPKSDLIDKVLYINEPMFIVVEEFNLYEHCIKMKKNHPSWSIAQQRNVIYWQKIPRKNLIPKVKLAMELIGLDEVCFFPEGNGVNVYITAFHSGLRLEPIKSLKIHRQIAIIGYKL